MALPKVEDTNIVDTIAEIEAEEAANTTTVVEGELIPADDKAGEAAQETTTAEVNNTETKTEAPAADQAIAEVKPAAAPVVASKTETDKFLAEQGFGNDTTLDFTSFPMVTLNNEVFSTPENKNFGTSFECYIMAERDLYLLKGDRGRAKEPLLVYSDDGLIENKATGEDGSFRTLASYIEEWKQDKEVIGIEKATYRILIGEMTNGPHAGEFVQIQVSPSSVKKWNGYKQGLAWKKINIASTLTEVSVGATIGSGASAFNPFVFKRVG